MDCINTPKGTTCFSGKDMVAAVSHKWHRGNTAAEGTNATQAGGSRACRAFTDPHHLPLHAQSCGEACDQLWRL